MFNEDYFMKYEFVNFKTYCVGDNLVKLQKLVPEGKISWTTSSHLGQWHRPH
jgi:hypothetical protein